MLRVLIGHSSELFAQSIAKKLGDGFDYRICLDGSKIGQLLDSYRPDILILHGVMPRKDTMTILCEHPMLPRITLVTVNYLSADAEWRLRSLGVRQVLLMPSPGEVVQCLQGILSRVGELERDTDSYRVRMHLLALNFDTHLEGFRLICSAVPMLMKDPGQTLSKHIYPAVAKQHELTDQRAVEHSIRNSIEKAWRRRDESVWLRFFPADASRHITCPSNRKVLTTLAEWIALKK